MLINKILAIGITFLFLGVSINTSIAFENLKESYTISNGNTLYVGGSGPDNYTRIMNAVVDANPYDTVYVYDDSSPYYENINVNKPIFLIGEDRDTTVIDGNHYGNVVYIQSNDVFISGFTIKNCEASGNEWRYSAIKIMRCEDVVIKDNKISIGHLEYNDWVAGVLLESSSYNLIQDNIIYQDEPARRDVGVMIHDDSDFNNVSGNEIYGNEINKHVHGIGIWSQSGYDNCDGNILYGNNIHDNTKGIGNCGDGTKILNNIITDNSCRGIENEGAKDTIISYNTISYNGCGGEFDCGIILVTSSNIHISDNEISRNNPTGLYMLSGSDYVVIRNNIRYNKQIGVYAFFTERSIFSKNNFVYNSNYNALFENDFKGSFSDRWRRNYWNDNHGILTYRIKGFIYLWGLIFFRFPWRKIDWLPARKPFDIKV